MPDRNSFISALFECEYPTLIRLAYRLTGSRELARDLLQDTFLLAMVHYEELAVHPSPGGWLNLTLRNLAWNERRRIKRHSQTSLEEAAHLLTGEASQSLDELLPLQLSPEDRDILIWRFERQWDYREIALRLGISEGACRMRVSRAVKKCGEILKDLELQ